MASQFELESLSGKSLSGQWGSWGGKANSLGALLVATYLTESIALLSITFHASSITSFLNAGACKSYGFPGVVQIFASPETIRWEAG